MPIDARPSIGHTSAQHPDIRRAQRISSHDHSTTTYKSTAGPLDQRLDSHAVYTTVVSHDIQTSNDPYAYDYDSISYSINGQSTNVTELVPVPVADTTLSSHPNDNAVSIEVPPDLQP